MEKADEQTCAPGVATRGADVRRFACASSLVPDAITHPLGRSRRRGEEVRFVDEGLGGIPLCGFSTYGGFARTHGVNGFRDQTLVVVVLG